MPSKHSHQKSIFIAGGGTGGHIYPGLAIAEELKQQGYVVHFIGTKHGLETKIIPKNNFTLHLISVGGINGVSFFKKIIVLFKMPWAIFKSMGLLLKYKPSFVLGVGGYSSGPFVLMASLMGVQTGIFESNAIPGITNRILSRFTTRAFVLFEESKKYLKSKDIKVLGFPVRQNMTVSPKREHPNLRVLVFGGSQGARGINVTVSLALSRFKEELKDIEFVHQTGKRDFSSYKKIYEKITNVQCLEYLDPMKDYYDWADLIFCRAGASTLSELSACGKAAILIPFPHASDNHQQKNAESLVKKSAVKMILQKDFTAEAFLRKIQEYRDDRSKIEILETNIQKNHIPNAAQNITQEIIKALS